MTDKRVIFESEEDLEEFCNVCGIEYDYLLRRCIKHGLIRRSPVEEAEEMYNDKIKERNNNEYTSKYSISQVVDKLYEALQYFKKQLEEK